MERSDVWLLRSEEELFNANAHGFNEKFLPLIDTDYYLGAFIHIHRRQNPLIPLWAVGCNASGFVALVTEQWDLQAERRPNSRDINAKRAMVIGSARRLCSLPLRMDPQSPHDHTYISTAQKRGLLYHVRDDIPSPHVHAMQRYDGTDAATRLEGAEVLSILAHLFVTLGVEVPDFTNIPRLCYAPYKRPPPPTTGKFVSPDRRLCSSLAYTAFHVRASKATSKGKGADIKLPFGLLGQDQADSVTSFSKEDFRQQSNVNDAKNPLQVAMSTLAGKLCELHDLGCDVCHLPRR
jgi:hypothetical protein